MNRFNTEYKTYRKILNHPNSTRRYIFSIWVIEFVQVLLFLAGVTIGIYLIHNFMFKLTTDRIINLHVRRGIICWIAVVSGMLSLSFQHTMSVISKRTPWPVDNTHKFVLFDFIFAVPFFVYVICILIAY